MLRESLWSLRSLLTRVSSLSRAAEGGVRSQRAPAEAAVLGARELLDEHRVEALERRGPFQGGA